MILQSGRNGDPSTRFSTDNRNPYELAWNCAIDGKAIIEVPSGRIVDCNPAAEALMRTPKADLLGRQVYELVPEEEKARVIEELRKFSSEPSRIEGLHAITSDRRAIPVLISASGIIDVGDNSFISIVEFQDVSFVREQEHRLATKRWALSAYASAAVALSQEHSPSSLFSAICEAIVTEPTYVLSWIGIAENDDAKTIRLTAQAGPAVGIMDGHQLSWSSSGPYSQGPAPKAIRTGKLQTVNDTRLEKPLSPWTERFTDYRILSCAAIPFKTPEGLSGAIIVCASKPKAFEPVALEVFTHLAEQLGHGLHTIEQQEMLNAERDHSAESDRRMIEAMSRMMEPVSMAMEMRDPYTAGHQTRVAEIAVAIASEMGLSSERQKGLHLAAQVHDIGKMSVPSEILTKPGRLSPSERALLNEHCENGYNILKGIPFPWPIAAIVRQHHEKLDGSGYPAGLTADEILPESKIMAVADMFEAMTAHRPYRPGIPVDNVLAMLEAESGTKLDPDAVRICASLCRQGRFQHLLPK